MIKTAFLFGPVCAGILEQSMGARNRVGIVLSYRQAIDGIFKLLRSPGIDSKETIPPAYVACAGILEQSIGNRVAIGLPYRSGR
jgi:hypothetical protein